MTDIEELTGRTLVLVAHPDDEAVGCGALLQRMADPIVAFATDGAPMDSFFWKGCGSRENYAQTRKEESRQALSEIGVSQVEFAAKSKGEDIGDQTLYEHMSEAFAWCAMLVERHRPEAILTLAYEGGHPDHDSCSVLAAKLGQEHGLSIWEMPLYHRNSTGQIAYQTFVELECCEGDNSANCADVLLEIAPDELRQKLVMLGRYRSQHPFLLEFNAEVERFRRQPTYDYSRPPHAGKLNYEAWEWKMTGAGVCAAFMNFLKHATAGRP